MLGSHSFDLRNIALIVGSLGANAAMAWPAEALCVLQAGILGHEKWNDVVKFHLANLEAHPAFLAVPATTGESFNSDTLREFNALHLGSSPTPPAYGKGQACLLPPSGAAFPLIPVLAGQSSRSSGRCGLASMGERSGIFANGFGCWSWLFPLDMVLPPEVGPTG
jgi:hypothetical protein